MSSVDEIEKLIEELYTVERILAAMQKKPNNYAKVSLYASEAHTLKLIAQNEGISQAELSEQMYRTSGATSVMVDKLVKKGLVNRCRKEGNQRRYLLTLTEQGKKVNEAHITYDIQHAHWALEQLGLSKEELQVTNRAITRIIEVYSQHYLKNGMMIEPDQNEM